MTDPIAALKAAERAARARAGREAALREEAVEARSAWRRRIEEAISHTSARIDEAAKYTAASLSDRGRPFDVIPVGPRAWFGRQRKAFGWWIGPAGTSALTPTGLVLHTRWGRHGLVREETTAGEWFASRVATARIGEKPSELLVEQAVERGPPAYDGFQIWLESRETSILRELGDLLGRE